MEKELFLDNKVKLSTDIVYAYKNQKLAVLKSIVVDPKFQGYGVGTRLVEESTRHLKISGAEAFISIAWTSSKGTHIGGIYANLNFVQLDKVEKFWSKDSEANEYSCPECGTPPCQCSAVIYKLIA